MRKWQMDPAATLFRTQNVCNSDTSRQLGNSFIEITLRLYRAATINSAQPHALLPVQPNNFALERTRIAN